MLRSSLVLYVGTAGELGEGSRLISSSCSEPVLDVDEVLAIDRMLDDSCSSLLTVDKGTRDASITVVTR